jgi:dTDP-4-dehydrorhamnose reductase
MNLERHGIELWAGAECTVNRVGDVWRDQTMLTGHQHRLDDIERLADLGASAVRFPVLWERTAPGDMAAADWSWSDVRLARLRELAIRPIVGLVHHGSGPACTSLLDDAFPQKLAVFARAVAERYPWVQDFTPVNEPLTTARFSALYGLWYPHTATPRDFARALINQCRGIAAAMRAIREVIPSARLLQTEDVGTVFSTPSLSYQAAFENERRWLSLDLILGRVTPEHPIWNYLIGSGVSARELELLALRACAPDTIGINYYVTSDRFLDERLERYPRRTHGGNGRQVYADVEAVRVRAEGIVGHFWRLCEAWQRYHVPLAITEVHLGCTRDEQLRWLNEAWRGAQRAWAVGVDVRAVTVWSAFGSVDWDSLLVREQGHYEPGSYDVRSNEPRPTALAVAAQELAEKGQCSHPVASQAGWWRSDRRFEYPRVGKSIAPSSEPRGRPVLITGGGGTLAHAFANACERRGIAFCALSRSELDIVDRDAVRREVESKNPWAVINAAGYQNVDRAQYEGVRCYRDNTQGVAVLAAVCAAQGARLVTFSSSLVFDGKRPTPYTESHPVMPLGVYGWSKARAERAALERHPSALVVRTSDVFGSLRGSTFLDRALAALARDRPFLAPEDLCSSATYLPDLVDRTLDLLIDAECGIWHLSNQGATSPAELARRAATACDLPTALLLPCRSADLKLAAPRPAYTAIESERAAIMPTLESSLERYAQQWRAARTASHSAGLLLLSRCVCAEAPTG